MGKRQISAFEWICDGCEKAETTSNDTRPKGWVEVMATFTPLPQVGEVKEEYVLCSASCFTKAVKAEVERLRR